jgi:hypothetical protein
MTLATGTAPAGIAVRVVVKTQVNRLVGTGRWRL